MKIESGATSIGSTPLTCLVLVGGASHRMGENKAFTKVGGVFLLERVLQALSPLSKDLLLISNLDEPYRYLNLPIIHDIESGYGPLMGLYSGLRAASHELCVLVACDMPFASTSLISHLVTLADDFDVVIPQTEDGLHPLCAVYRRSTCLPAIESAMARRKRRMIAFFDDVRVRIVEEHALAPFDPMGVALMNVNTPEELAIAQKLAQHIHEGGKDGE